MGNDTIYCSNIYKVKKNGAIRMDSTTVCYRIISIDNIYFFAEEIITGAIFPLFGFDIKKDYNKNNLIFKDYSYLRSAKYGVLSIFNNGDDVFKYKLYDDESLASVGISKPNSYQLDAYMLCSKNDYRWKELMRYMESQNIYMCSFDIIKKNIEMAKKNNFEQNIISSSVLDDNGNCNYVPLINLDKIKDYGYDLSFQKELCNLVGRDTEKKRILKSVFINGDCVILVGESGAGKTSIVESLAFDIKNGTCDWLLGKVIFCLDVSFLTNGTMYRGTFEEKIKIIIDFCVEHKDKIVLFIDEMHCLYGLGRSENNTIDAMNILKPYISRGDISIIGATTIDEYNKYMANDPAFVSRFDIIKVPVLDENMNVQIILSYINYLEDKYNIDFSLSESQRYSFAKYIISITDIKNQRVVSDIIKENNPRISKKILRNAFAEAVFNRKKEVTIEDICFAIFECDKFSPTYKEEKISELKRIIQVNNKQKSKVLSFVK